MARATKSAISGRRLWSEPRMTGLRRHRLDVAQRQTLIELSATLCDFQPQPPAHARLHFPATAARFGSATFFVSLSSALRRDPDLGRGLRDRHDASLRRPDRHRGCCRRIGQAWSSRFPWNRVRNAAFSRGGLGGEATQSTRCRTVSFSDLRPRRRRRGV
jgi:hypothetical protein